MTACPLLDKLSEADLVSEEGKGNSGDRQTDGEEDLRVVVDGLLGRPTRFISPVVMDLLMAVGTDRVLPVLSAWRRAFTGDLDLLTTDKFVTDAEINTSANHTSDDIIVARHTHSQR